MYDKRTSGTPAMGCALKKEFDAFGLEHVYLKMWDRLEPWPGMLDHATLVTRAEPVATINPMLLRFWRRNRESSALDRNPIYDKELGISQEISSVDILHTLNLGPWLRYCSTVFWELLNKNVCQIKGLAA